jgi:hypothetical protein
MVTDKIAFELFGLQLLEPMAMVTNWMMAIFSIYAFLKLKPTSLKTDVYYWKKFFFWFAIAAFFGGIGHLFFNYFGIHGKFPNWITAIIAGYYAAMAVVINSSSVENMKKHKVFVLVKGGLLLILAIYFEKFVFIAADAILTYIIYCGFISNAYVKQGLFEMKYMVYGVLVCLPSVFIFFFKLNPHRWLNKDDLSHLLMLACIYFFYLGAKKRMDNNSMAIN